MSLFWLLSFNAAENWLSVNVLATLVNDCIADLSDKDYQASWGVIAGRVGPDHKNHVHDGHKEVWDLSEVLAKISKLIEKAIQGLKVLVVLITFSAGSLNFLLELAERSSICGFVLLEELKDLLDSLWVELLTNGIKVVWFVLPELNLS